MIKLDLNLQVVVDSEKVVSYTTVLNGIEHNFVPQKVSSKSIVEPTVVGMEVRLFDNRLNLSKDVCDAMGARVGDKLNILYVDNGKGQQVPYLQLSNQGNKLSGNLSIGYRGKKYDELAIFGTIFKVEQTNNRFKLIGNINPTIASSASKAIEELDCGFADISDAFDFDDSDISL